MACPRCEWTGWICEDRPLRSFPLDVCPCYIPCPECHAPRVWTLRQVGRTLTCRICDNSYQGHGFNVQANVQVFDVERLRFVWPSAAVKRRRLIAVRAARAPLASSERS